MNRFVFLLGLTLTFFLPAIFHAQGHDGLNPNAQAAFDRGVAASDQSDWTRALVEFTEAQKMAPTNPKILYNLGFAHAHLGNQIAAVAWLHAYIAAVPTGSNVPKVQLEIAKLEGIARSEEESIFERAIEAANLLKPDLNASDLKRLVKLVAGIAGEAGYSQGFGPIADIEPILRQDSADSYWYNYARTQAQDGVI